VNKNARRAGEMDLIDFFRGDQKAFDMQHIGREERSIFFAVIKRLLTCYIYGEVREDKMQRGKRGGSECCFRV
jgi:hypothetical protein